MVSNDSSIGYVRLVERDPLRDGIFPHVVTPPPPGTAYTLDAEQVRSVNLCC